MKVLQLISSAGYYGAEAVVVNLSKQLNALGAISTVGTFHNAHCPNSELAGMAVQQGLAVETVSCKGRLDWGTVRAIRGIVRQKGMDIVHTHGYKSHIYGYLAARKLPCAMVATCHGHPSVFRKWNARLRKRAYAALESILLRRFDRVIAVSPALSNSLRKAGVAPERLAVIANGIDFEEFSSARPSIDIENRKLGKLAIGVVGRLTEGKGHMQLFHALPSLLAQHPETLLFVVGAGPLKEQLERLAGELGIAANVIFTGRRDDMPNVYAALDLLVLPSLFEGMPVVILEAMAAGKPVIATRVGAIPEVVVDEKTGLLVEPADVHSIESGLDRLVGDAELRRTLGENGSMLVRERFSAAGMAHKYLRLYESAVR